MKEQIQQLIQDSQTIAEEVDLKNWSTVQSMAQDRQKNLEQFFAKPVAAKDADIVSMMINKILEIDKQIIGKIVTEKTDTINSIHDLTHLSKVKNTYQNVAEYTANT